MDQNGLNQVGCMIVRTIGISLIVLSLIVALSSWLQYEMVSEAKPEEEVKSGWTNYPPLEEFAAQEEIKDYVYQVLQRYQLHQLMAHIYGALFGFIVGMLYHLLK